LLESLFAQIHIYLSFARGPQFVFNVDAIILHLVPC